MNRPMNTPISPGAIENLRTNDVTGDLARAWSNAGSHPEWHHMAQRNLLDLAPALGFTITALATQYVREPGVNNNILKHLTKAASGLWHSYSPYQQSEIRNAMPVVADCLSRIDS